MLKNITFLLTVCLVWSNCNALNRSTISDIYIKAALNQNITYSEKSVLNTRKNKDQELAAYKKYIAQLKKSITTKNMIVKAGNKAEICDIDNEICVIPEGVKALGQNLFMNDKSFSYIVLPETLLCIDTHAFSGTNIGSIHIPDSTVLIAPLAFVNCRDLECVYVSKNTYICEKAFYICPRLKIIYRD